MSQQREPEKHAPVETKGSAKGGREGFDWAHVKEAEHRGKFLGNSVMTPVGLWAKNKDPNWYMHNKSKPASQLSLAEEKRRIQQEEQAQLAQALSGKDGLATAESVIGASAPFNSTSSRKRQREDPFLDTMRRFAPSGTSRRQTKGLELADIDVSSRRRFSSFSSSSTSSSSDTSRSYHSHKKSKKHSSRKDSKEKSHKRHKKAKKERKTSKKRDREAKSKSRKSSKNEKESRGRHGRSRHQK